MAFQTNTTNQTVATNQNESWKADRFINVWITMKDGSRRKVGFMTLKKSNRFENALIERLDQGEEAVEAFKTAIEIDYNSANGEGEISFDF